MDDFASKQTQLAKMKNIGLKSAGWMIEVGVDTPEELAEIGAVETYARMKAAYPRHVSLCALWALQGALQGIPYMRLDSDEKEALNLAYQKYMEAE